MQTKQKSIFFYLATAVVLLALFVFSPLTSSPIYAQEGEEACETTFEGPVPTTVCGDEVGEGIGSPDSTGDDPGGVPDVPEADADIVPIEENPIIEWMAYIINVMLIGVGIVVVGAIIVSGIQYMLSQGNSQKTAAARDRIISSLIGIALYSVMALALQWLVPGGIFD